MGPEKRQPTKKWIKTHYLYCYHLQQGKKIRWLQHMITFLEKENTYSTRLWLDDLLYYRYYTLILWITRTPEHRNSYETWNQKMSRLQPGGALPYWIIIGMCGQNGWVFQAENLQMGVHFWPKTCGWVIILIQFYLGMGGFPLNWIKPTAV